jgi:tetratricopeptide (TPR) repeat protein
MSEQTASSAIARGEALIDLGRHAEAVEAFRAAVAAEPESLEPYWRLAAALVSVDPREALGVAETAVRLGPEEAPSHTVLAAALHALGRYREAVEAAEEAVRLEPEAAFVHEILADVRLARGDRAGAREAALTARDLDPDTVGPHQSLGDIALDGRKFAAAEQHYRAALAIDPEHIEVLNNLGVTLQAQKRDDEAREVLERAVRLDPRADLTRENLAANSRGYVNGVLVFLAAYLAYEAARTAMRGDHPALAIPIAAVALVVFAVAARQRRRRMATLSPGVQRLLEDQPWHERLQVRRWRPLAWFIPAPVWLVLGLLIVLGFGLSASQGGAADWDLSEYVVLAAALLLICGSGYFTWRRLRR